MVLMEVWGREERHAIDNSERYAQAAHGALHTGKNSQRCAHILVYWRVFQLIRLVGAQCYAQTDNATDCRPQGDDYVECLFHQREVDFVSSWYPRLHL